MSKVNPDAAQKIQAYLDKRDDAERAIITSIREAAHDAVAEIQDDYKWQWPCLNHHGLVCSYGAHKHHMVVHFFQGALINDTAEVLSVGPSGNAAMRTWKFTKDDPLDLDTFKAYVREAAANNAAGKKVDLTKTRKPLVIPEAFKKVLQSNEVWNTFDGMSYSNKKEYVEFFTEAKREETKERRMKKVIDLLAKGSGLNDKYK
ncbi:YdeI/OmpD-associated family protein [Sanyastnella coralliicola]|uniref:YdeI/OmpD-associated family protein n=1 Tax=Sanyastnella coralliicola TaxID=3069118 RepID=UPI0027B9637B|nr:YdeI/OmpD-associated family protein [Longitalea sp. SCSIO 12813]